MSPIAHRHGMDSLASAFADAFFDLAELLALVCGSSLGLGEALEAWPERLRWCDGLTRTEISLGGVRRAWKM